MLSVRICLKVFVMFFKENGYMNIAHINHLNHLYWGEHGQKFLLKVIEEDILGDKNLSDILCNWHLHWENG